MTEKEESKPEPLRQSFVEYHQINPVKFAIFCLVMIFILYQLVAGTITFFLMGTTTVTRENAMMVRLLTLSGQILFILLPTMFLARLFTRTSSDLFPWRISKLPEIVYALAGLVFLQQIFQIYLFFQDMIPLPEVLQRYVSEFKTMIDEMFKNLVTADSVPELMVVVLVVALVPSVVEEFFFRGLVQGAMERGMNALKAALLTGVIFGIYHFNPIGLVPLVGLGCYFGILRMRSQSIVVPMTAHFVNNMLAVLAVYFSVNDDTIVGINKDGGHNTGVIISQLVVYTLLFITAFLAYLRTTANVGKEDS